MFKVLVFILPLGDSGYASEPWLMLPILNAEPDSAEENYTTVHCKSRCCVERCFGVMKNRWRCLIRHRCLHYDPPTSALLIYACTILHNIAIEARLPAPAPMTEEEALLARERDYAYYDPTPIRANEDLLARAYAIRSTIVTRLQRQQ